MTRLMIAVAVAVAVSPVAAFAQPGMDLQPGDKAIADPQLPQLNVLQMSPDEITNNSMAMKNPSGPKVTKVTGTIQIKTGKGVMTVKAGQPVPPIPEGAEIVVVSGEAVVEKGGVTVTAGAGDSFTISEGKNGVAVTATGKTDGITVAVKDTKAVITAGSGVAVKGGTVTVAAGTASISQRGTLAQTVQAGKTFNEALAMPESTNLAQTDQLEAPESLPFEGQEDSSPSAGSPVQEKQTAPVSPSAP